MNQQADISIIVPCYNEEATLPMLYKVQNTLPVSKTKSNQDLAHSKLQKTTFLQETTA